MTFESNTPAKQLNGVNFTLLFKWKFERKLFINYFTSFAKYFLVSDCKFFKFKDLNLNLKFF